jgi:hypothetical protein
MVVVVVVGVGVIIELLKNKDFVLLLGRGCSWNFLIFVTGTEAFTLHLQYKQL